MKPLKWSKLLTVAGVTTVLVLVWQIFLVNARISDLKTKIHEAGDAVGGIQVQAADSVTASPDNGIEDRLRKSRQEREALARQNEEEYRRNLVNGFPEDMAYQSYMRTRRELEEMEVEAQRRDQDYARRSAGWLTSAVDAASGIQAEKALRTKLLAATVLVAGITAIVVFLGKSPTPFKG